MSKLRIISDVHGKYDEYVALTKECDFSIQLGDMGFNYKELANRKVDSDKHKMIIGNHDNYDKCYLSKYTLESNKRSNDYGLANHGGLDFFFVRGAFSIDWESRLRSMLTGDLATYWENEELSIEDMKGCLLEYRNCKPSIVLSHDCPSNISKLMDGKDILNSYGYGIDNFTTKTGMLLEMMRDYHRPKIHFFGHYHTSFDQVIDGTRFVCMPELGYYDMEI